MTSEENDDISRTIQLYSRDVPLPVVMPGETVDEHSFFGAAYDWNGRLIDADPVAGGMLMANWNARKDHQFRTSMISPIAPDAWFEIMTTWLGMNHNSSGGVPLVWETMAASSDQWLDFRVRYATEAAARHGHLQIITVLLSAGLKVTKTTVEIPELEP